MEVIAALRRSPAERCRVRTADLVAFGSGTPLGKIVAGKSLMEIFILPILMEISIYW